MNNLIKGFCAALCLCLSQFSLAMSEPPAGIPAADSGHVCFWEDTYYQGQKFCYTDDVNMVTQDANDKFSSMKVYNGYYAEIFKGEDYSNNNGVVMIDTPVLDYLKDDISSFKIKRRQSDDFACLHENLYFSGTPFCLEAGQQRADLTNYNDKASGLSIFGNVQVKVWKDKAFKESSDTLLLDYAKLENTDLNGGENWNDKISSFKVEAVANLEQTIADYQWCSADSHCNVGGKCLSGKCECAGGMSGELCDKLDLKPTENGQGVYQDTTNSHWGSSPILGDDGRFHLFASRFTNSCGLDNWLANSECIRASSSSPTGPYVFEEVVQGVFCHNPTVRQAPDGSFLLFYIGDDLDIERTQCANGQSFEPGPGGLNVDNCEIRIKRAKTINGPWSDDHKATSVALNGICPTNPAPVVEEDGSIKLYYRDYELVSAGIPSYYDYSVKTTVPERMYMLKANKWNGIYTQQQPNPILFEYSEDGYAWKSKGGYHMVFNNKFSHEFYKGGYASSKDGVKWRVRGSVYTKQVPYASGELKNQRRERPQMLWLNQDEGKGVLFNGVQIGPGDKTTALAFNIGEWDNYFALQDKNTELCMTVMESSVAMQTCTAQNQAQQWYFDFDQQRLVNQVSGQCLNSTEEGLNTVVCNNSSSQQFSFQREQIQLHADSDKALSVSAGQLKVAGGKAAQWRRIY